MHYAYVVYAFLVWEAAASASAAAAAQHHDVARTEVLTRLPFFGGGVTQLLRYIRPVEQPANGRRSALRQSLDENYVSYRGAQLWKLNFNGTRRRADSSPDAHFNGFVEEFGE